MEITYRNDPEDLRLAYKTLSWLDYVRARGFDLWVVIAGGLLPGAGFLIVRREWYGLIVGTGTAVAIVVLIAMIRRYKARRSFTQLKEQTLRLRPEWLEAQSEASWSRRRWETVSQVLLVKGGVVISLESWMWFIIPIRAFSSADEARQFAALAMRYKDESRGQLPATNVPLPDWFQHPVPLFQCTYQPTKDEIRQVYGKAQTLARSPGSPPKSRSTLRVIAGLWIGISVLILFAIQFLPSTTRPTTTPRPPRLAVLYVGSCGVLWILGILVLNRRRTKWLVERFSLREEQLTLTISGCLLRSSGRIAFLHWNDVRGVFQSDRAILLQLNSNLFHLIPTRAFTSQEQVDVFFQSCHEYWTVSQTRSAEAVAVNAILVDTGNPYQPPRER